MLSFEQLYKSCVRNVLQGHVLALEDMVDILTLKEKADDHAIALQLIKTATVCGMTASVSDVC